MQYPVAIIASVAMFLTLGSRERLETRDSFEFEPTTQTVRKIRWPRKTIEISLSTSLFSPGANIKPDSDVIVAADISINPRPRAEDGAELQFSTDGTPGTYDLEATFTHEIGHFLGLDHSILLSSTMQGRQSINGTFGLPALTGRTLSEEDRQKIRNLYGPKQRLGRIE